MNFIIHLWPYISLHAYLFLFVGMLVGGETFLLPAAYLGAQGMLSFSEIFLFASLATMISDTAWYGIGRFVSLQKILSWKMFFKKRDVVLEIFAKFQAHGEKILFISKFVYGTRTLAQVLSGTIRMPFLKYSVVNLAGILSYLSTICFIALFTNKSLANFGKISYNKYIGVPIFIIFVLIAHICLKKWLGKKISASSSRHGTKKEQ